MLNEKLIFSYLVLFQVESGSKVELPFWLAQELHLRQVAVMALPSCFNQR